MAAMQKNRRLKYLAASTALAVCSAGAVNLAIAACTFALAQDGPTGQDLGNGLYLVQFTPSGNFSPSDGRPMDVPSWHINAQLAADVIARNRARLKPVVIDYEHQTLNKEKNGQPASLLCSTCISALYFDIQKKRVTFWISTWALSPMTPVSMAWSRCHFWLLQRRPFFPPPRSKPP